MVICLFGILEGVVVIEVMVGDWDVIFVLGVLDECFNDKGYIVFGFGDVGDWFYGIV